MLHLYLCVCFFFYSILFILVALLGLRILPCVYALIDVCTLYCIAWVLSCLMMRLSNAVYSES